MLIWKIKNALFRLTHPSFWLQNVRTSYEWDAQLRQLMQEHGVRRIDNCTADVGGVTIWIKNYPYGFGKRFMSPLNGLPIPAPITRRRIIEALDRDLGRTP
jgi:hypothetical protein